MIFESFAVPFGVLYFEKSSNMQPKNRQKMMKCPVQFALIPFLHGTSKYPKPRFRVVPNPSLATGRCSCCCLKELFYLPRLPSAWKQYTFLHHHFRKSLAFFWNIGTWYVVWSLDAILASADGIPEGSDAFFYGFYFLGALINTLIKFSFRPLYSSQLN